MRIYYIANARMPTEKAHGIQTAKMCEAFIKEGVEVKVVLPSRKNIKQSIEEFYNLETPIQTVTVPSLDWYTGGRVPYTLSALSFALSYTLYLLTHLKPGDIIYSVDFDHLFYIPMPFLRAPYFLEMHGGKPNTLIHRLLFKKIAGVIPTNHITKKELEETFGLQSEQLIVEPNGVDFTKFSPLKKTEARDALNLPQDMKLALYVGRFFDWKGLDTLSDAAALLSDEITIGTIGGSREEFERVTKKNSERIRFFGEKSHGEVREWMAAADVLLVLGTMRDKRSYLYTSPMKVFEYMAMRRPTIASRTPALQTILSEDECYFYEPDNPQDLAHCIQMAVHAEDESRAEKAFNKVSRYSWKSRAERVLQFIEERSFKNV